MDILQAALTEQTRPVQKRELDAALKAVELVLLQVQQQIIALDVSLSMVLEKLSWTKEQLDEFKAELRSRVEKIGAEIVAQAKAKPKVSL